MLTLYRFLAMLYLIRPQLLHRFVGYLEETAVHTCEHMRVAHEAAQAPSGATTGALVVEPRG